jgi:hypothetical protein
MSGLELAVTLLELAELAPDLLVINPAADFSYILADQTRVPLFVPALMHFGRKFNWPHHSAVAAQTGTSDTADGFGPWEVHEGDIPSVQAMLQAYCQTREWEWRVGRTYMDYNAEIWPDATKDGFYGDSRTSAAEALAVSLVATLRAQA